MDLFTELAMNHICRDPNEFINPRFNFGGPGGGTVFLSINAKIKHICVVAADTSADGETLAGQINDYQNYWLDPLKETKQLQGYFEEGYHFHIKAYLREEVADHFRDQLTIHPKDIVQIRSFEEIGYPWEWEA